MKNEYAILTIDPYLQPYAKDIELRMENYKNTKKRLLSPNTSLSSFANGHLYFGFHKDNEGWYYREWAPNAKNIALIGDFNHWNRESHPMAEISPGIWEIYLPGINTIPHQSKIKIEITTADSKFDRIPLYCKRVIQDPETKAFDGQFWNPETPFIWTDHHFPKNTKEPLLIYESHIGMSGLKEGISSYRDYADFVLPHVKKLGYNTIQLMAIAEHPYYGSFGYQVTNFFAASSRFGSPEDLKYLINTAHNLGITVLLDLVHSHAATNVLEGLGAFDGTEVQFFHAGSKGFHPAWKTKLFNYGKPEVIHFLLSNIKFWMKEYHFDGFRFDGVTSMLYHDHGLGEAFDNYQKYFSLNTDCEAITYLQLATELAKETNPDCILIAEDMSGLPGMCLPISDGGIGFDYRLGMGLPDFWIKTLREKRDEDWELGTLWHQLTQRRPKEKTIGYCESHDQALVGDKTMMFWLADKEMYTHMATDTPSLNIDRAMALHKMIRMITCSCAGEGYLTFMGNEFGHPEWVDFPREGNQWSYFYARRRWDLADDEHLRYHFLQAFDTVMIELVKNSPLLNENSDLKEIDEENKTILYFKGDTLFAFNFHPQNNHISSVFLDIPVHLELILHSEWPEFGGLRECSRSLLLSPAFLSPKVQINIPMLSRSVSVYKCLPYHKHV
ncbi:MAG: alpha-amylase family glycosyl hydrolase [Eubacteriaceae bacterium]